MQWRYFSPQLKSAMSWCNKPFAVIANLWSATKNPEVGRQLSCRGAATWLYCTYLWPISSPIFSVQPLWCHSQKYKPGKWRLIFNLSASHNHAVKDAILKEALLTIPCFGGWCGFFNPVDGVYLAVCGDKKGPLFHFDDGRSSMRERFMQAVCNAVAKAGQVYVAHSFRIRSVMTAAHYGILNLVIQTLGWWQSSVFALCLYTYGASCNITSANL